MKKMIMIIMIALISASVSCTKGHEKTKQTEVIMIEPKTLSTTLYYAGTIQPLKSLVITAPSDGVIDEVAFHYGEKVVAGQLLFSISSEKFLSDYKNAVMQYFKAKNDFMTSRGQLSESEFLHRNELISNDALKEKKNSFYTSQLAFLQAKDALTNFIKRIDLKGFNPYELSIADIEKITKILQVQGESQKLRVTALGTGIGLLPVSGENGESAAKRYTSGDQVKQGDVLALIGDLQGLRVRINVNEFNVNQLQLGQKVRVTGVAFQEFILQGEIVGIDHQAQPSSGGTPTFPVDIIIPHLTPEQQAIIHVGMSAKVEVDIQGEQQISLPIAAVYEKQGLPYVRVKDKSGDIHEVLVKTGQTSVDTVTILDGLKPGDEVLNSANPA